MTDDTRIKTDITLEDAPRAVIEAAARIDASVEDVAAYKCIGHGGWVYTLRDDRNDIIATVDERGENAGHLHSVFDTAGDPWKPDNDGDEHLCEGCYDDILQHGSHTHARNPQGGQITLQHRHGVATHAHHHEYDDFNARLREHCCFPAAETIAGATDSSLPWESGWYATTCGDRQIEGDEMVDPFRNYNFPHDISGDYQKREAFAAAVFNGDIDLPTAIVWRGSTIYVPEGDVDLVREAYAVYARRGAQRTNEWLADDIAA